MKTYLYNIDPLKPHFYIVKLGFTGVYIIFLISAQKHRLWYSLEPPRRGGSNEYPQAMFLSRIMKNIRVFIVKFSVFGGEIVFIYLNRRVFVMYLSQYLKFVMVHEIMKLTYDFECLKVILTVVCWEIFYTYMEERRKSRSWYSKMGFQAGDLTLKAPVTTIVVCFVICRSLLKSLLQTVWTQIRLLLGAVWSGSTLFAYMQE